MMLLLFSKDMRFMFIAKMVMNRRADHISAELDRCLVNSEVAYEAPFDVNDSFAEVFDAFVDSQGKD